jgi:hypothetical protein
VQRVMRIRGSGIAVGNSHSLEFTQSENYTAGKLHSRKTTQPDIHEKTLAGRVGQGFRSDETDHRRWRSSKIRF